MKNRLKSLDLIEAGLSAKTVLKLTESQINTLHKKMVVKEQVTEIPAKPSYKVGEKGGTLPPSPKGYSVRPVPNTKEVIATVGEEMKEDETDDVTSSNAQGDVELQKLTGQEAPHDANDMAPDGMDDDSDYDREKMGMSESKKSKKDKNPWAICTAQLGNEFGTRERHLWSAKEKNKYERCVKDVKKSLKEGQNPVSLFIENEIMRIVEKNLPPKITKGDLLKYMTENSPTTAPPKPKKPTTRPDTKPRPTRPGQNPHPGEKESPRAEEVKKKVIKKIFKDIFKK